MKISIDEIPQTPKEIVFSESVEELNKIYSQSSNREFGFPASLEVELRYYRAAADLFFDGRISGELQGVCGRCAEDYLFRMDQPFEFALIPDPAKAERKAEELHRDDLGLSYYTGDEIDLAPLIAEQVILALPTQPLCAENCRGLCASCGTNLNRESCFCAAPKGDPRMAVFRTLKVGR
jgi:DUF177 domain-containing protein